MSKTSQKSTAVLAVRCVRPCWSRRRLLSALCGLISSAGHASAAGPSCLFYYCPVQLIHVTCFPQTSQTLAPTSSAHREPNVSSLQTPVQPPASVLPSESTFYSIYLSFLVSSYCCSYPAFHFKFLSLVRQVCEAS